jgi:arylsulfatase A-like enzyme
MDILPTVVDLAEINNKVPYHAPWDGISFATLLQSSRVASRRSQQQQQQQRQRRQQGAAVDGADALTQRCSRSSREGGQQACSKGSVQTKSSVQAALQDRFIVILGPQCWSPDAVPQLDANR